MFLQQWSMLAPTEDGKAEDEEGEDAMLDRVGLVATVTLAPAPDRGRPGSLR